MIKIIHPTKAVTGSIALPTSKSLSNRALIIQALCNNKPAITGLSEAGDTQILKRILEEKPTIADVGDAGTAMRFLLAYFSTIDSAITLTGSDRMKERPIGPLVDALRDMGSNITYQDKEGYPPVLIKGSTMLRKNVTIRSDVSSQFISALMLIGPAMGGINIRLQGEPASYSYIEMTAALMEHFGAEVTFGKSIVVGAKEYYSEDYNVEVDWSAASYFFEIAALAKQANIYIEKLPWYSIQGDSAIASLYNVAFGITSGAKFNGVHLQKGSLDVDMDEEYEFLDMPDMAQTVAATATGMYIAFNLLGLKTLPLKETDRIAALKTELEKTGVAITAGADSLAIKVPKQANLPKSVSFSTYGDHRMAMALAPLALVFDEVILDDETVVNKSFPTYWDELKKLGFEITPVS